MDTKALLEKQIKAAEVLTDMAAKFAEDQSADIARDFTHAAAAMTDKVVSLTMLQREE